MKYRISKQERRYSTTPIVEVKTDSNGKEQEHFLIWVNLPKKQGDEFSQKLVKLLNENV